MDFALSDEHRMLKELVARFVQDELMPLEAGVLAREADGKGLGIGAADNARLDEVSKSLGLWGLDAPEDVGGVDLPAVAMVGVNEELGKTQRLAAVCIVAELPRNAIGKVLKRELRARWEAEAQSPG